MPIGLESFWSLSAEQVLASLISRPEGLTPEEAAGRLSAPRPRPFPVGSTRHLLLSQFTSPIMLILIVAVVLSFLLRDSADAFIILGIILVSGLLGFWQEKGASDAVKKLLALVQTKVAVKRAGAEVRLAAEEVAPGDILVLVPGQTIPADALILESGDLFIDEAALTGETFPVEKGPGISAAVAPLAERRNALWKGTHVVSGGGLAVAVHIGLETEFGKITERLQRKPPETEFERGVRNFGTMLLEITLLMVLAIFACNVFLKKPVLESFLFSLAIAVGLTPQLLPVIISINLARGANRMAQRRVIVKRLAAIENFGSMNILCSDKTGTLTEGAVAIQAAADWEGRESEKLRRYAYINACFESGYTNPIDEAIRKSEAMDISAYRKQAELPYDFKRKRLSVLTAEGDGSVLITKGSVLTMLDICTLAEDALGAHVPLAQVETRIQERFAELSRQGLRTLGVGYKRLPVGTVLRPDQEADLVFLGFMVLADPLKAGIADDIRSLKSLGVNLKIISGDNADVAGTIGNQVGLNGSNVLTGMDLRDVSDDALAMLCLDADIFAEIEPNQKERLILAFKRAGQVVGYLGDGINDATALRAADVGISVDSAVDVAKNSADIVLLEKDLSVLEAGVREGRRTFANTLKYIFMATSANFGNMFSVTGASLFLPFLPLLPKQILLTNLLTDIPEMTIAADRVDSEWIEHPRRLDIGFIRRFMLFFGTLSSVFDYAAFAVLMGFFHATKAQFRTGWFLESVVSAVLIVLVVRTRRPAWQSKPGLPLLLATLAIAGATIAFPYTPLGPLLGFAPLGVKLVLAMVGIVILYIITAEVAKHFFYRSRLR